MTDLCNIYTRDFITAKPHLVNMEEAWPEPIVAESALMHDLDMEIERLQNYQGPDGSNILPEIMGSPNRFMASETRFKSYPYRRDDFTPASAGNLGSQSEPQLGTTVGTGVQPTPDLAASTGALGSELETLMTFLGERLGFENTGLSDITEVMNSAEADQQEIGMVGGEQSWIVELVPPHLPRAPLPPSKLDVASGILDFDKLWKPPPNRDYVPCVEPSSNYTTSGGSQGYLLVHTNGGLNQMRAGICDMVAVAQIINATLVIPELDKRSFWQDTSNFSDVFDQDHFISSLANDVKVIRKLPKELANATRAVKHFRSWSGIDYYQDEIASMWADYQVIRAAKSDSRLANNNLPPNIQKLRCRACYEALRFSPRIEAMGKLLVDRMRSYGPYIALHLRYEKDMLAFSGCTHDLSPEEADELKIIRENTVYWKVKDINSTEQRAKGYCPLTPKEVGIFLAALGFPSNTPIYIAAGEIYGGDSRMADLRSRYPLIMNKEKLASADELEPFINHASQMAALDYIVSVQSDIFIPSYSGNMARAVEGHRRFLGHRKTISPDRKALVHLFCKIEEGRLKEGKKLSTRVIEIHKRRQGSPRKRKGPISGTKGMDRFRSEEAFYVNPLPDCLCQKESLSSMNASFIIR